MLVSFEIAEIKKFPAEIRSFLNEYIQNQVSNSEEIKEQSSENNRIFNTDHEDAPIFTKHPDRRLVSSKKFDWYSMFVSEINSINRDSEHDFLFTVRPDKSTSVLFNRMQGGCINHDDPKTWGMALIFCCMFGFGGEFPGLNVAKTTKEIAENIKKVGLSGETDVSPKTVGPLLKTITSTLRLYAAKFLDGHPDSELHWFTFTSKTNEFYFAGETEKICFDVAGELARQFFLFSEEEFKKFE
tara:strand:+ start:133 stop:858 length:726 start_codon:yes stop_codon:yes gene_type:complete